MHTGKKQACGDAGVAMGKCPIFCILRNTDYYYCYYYSQLPDVQIFKTVIFP